MLKSVSLAIILAAAGAVPAMAQGATCTAPKAPGTIDGAKVTIDQLRTAINDAKAFIAASDTYQSCIGNDIAAQKAAATPDKPFNAALEAVAMQKVSDNQAMKQKVGDAINGAIADYKKAHPG